MGGLAYALLADEIHPLLPMVNTENIAIWIIAAVGLAELLKNVFYDPLVLGGVLVQVGRARAAKRRSGSA